MAAITRKMLGTDSVGYSRLKLRILERGYSSWARSTLAGVFLREDATASSEVAVDSAITEHTSVSLTLSGSLAPGWELLRPLEVTVEVDEDGSLVASDEIFLQYGVGNTVREALLDYASKLIELYHVWEEYAELQPETRASLQYFQTYLRPISK